MRLRHSAAGSIPCDYGTALQVQFHAITVQRCRFNSMRLRHSAAGSIPCDYGTALQVQFHVITVQRCRFNSMWLRCSAAGSGPQVQFLPGTKSCIFRSCFWLGLINLYKFPLDNFHLYNTHQIESYNPFSTSTVSYRTGEHAWIEIRLINSRTSGCIRVSKFRSSQVNFLVLTNQHSLNFEKKWVHENVSYSSWSGVRRCNVA
jgi:hypothetical protein